MTKPEAKVKDKVKEILSQYPVYTDMPVPGGFGKSGLDFHCCLKGRAFFIETKAKGKKLTPRQEGTKEDMEAAGGVVFVIEGTENLEQFEVLEDWLCKVMLSG